ncbi:Reverse transcriptase [Giardia lamblia P15]|uniref:Reverse transcriptase n=1 Tax=Giardia intestinalis (strain P15) TaxID=658858 RepID=E1F0M5_GIAIA|nr:Reverse transcriptase [Giardia lamblia P15]
MACRNAPDRSNVGLEHFPDSPEVLRYDPEYLFGQTKPALLNNQQYQSALELLATWSNQVNLNLQQGQQEPAPLVTLNPLPPEQARDAQSLTPPQRTLEPAELYERGITPDTYQHTVNASSLTADMLRYHNENEGLVCTRERLVRTIEKPHLSYESVEAFLDMLMGTKVGGIPTCPTCLRCYRSDLDLRRHLLETEHSTLEWHQVNLNVSRNGGSMCPLCSKVLRNERAVQTHCSTDTGCRALLRERMGLKERETNILFSTHRANMLRGGYTTPLIEPQSREARARQEVAEMSLAYTAGKRKNALAPPRQPTCPACSLRFASKAELAAHLSNATNDQHLAIQRGRIRMTGGWFKARDLALLSYLAGEFVGRTRAGPLTSGQCFVKLLGRCYMGDGRLSAPSKDRLAERVEDALVKGNCRRAMGLLSQRSLLNPDSPEGIRVAHELHPGPIEGYEAPVLQPTENMDLPARITEEEVVRAVKSMGLSKPPGPSGLGPAHWRVLIQAQGVPEALAQAFNEILGAAQRRGCRALYEFRLVLIPKDETGSKYRPIAISETIMMAFHKIVLSRLRTQILAFLETEQIAFRLNAHAVGVRMAYTEMQVDGTQAVSLDITNAFNSIPREEILRGLDQASVPLILRNYIEAFLQLRHAAHLDSLPRG